MIAIMLNALKIICVLGFLVLIHESGHFFVARLCKVSVIEFSIGFGPIILSKQGKQTKYALRLIPLGGFVNLEGEQEYSKKEGSFSNASIPKRMAIVLAGGLVNIIFGIIVYFILTASIGNNTSLVVQETIPGYAAQEVQIMPEDEITKINGQKVYKKSDIDKIMKKYTSGDLDITISRNGQEKEIKLIPTKQEYKSTGIYLKAAGQNTKIITLDANSIAEKKGIKPNDEILEINGKKVNNQNEVIEEINKSDELEIKLKRGKEELKINLIPDIKCNYYLGIYFKQAENTLSNNLYYSALETKEFILSIFDNIKMLITGNVRVDQFMGPIGISEVVANTNKIEDFINILALISLSLGVTNLLPIPALDGGKFLLLVIEAIRRKKISEKVENNIQLVGFTILIALSIYIAYNDILRIF